jgi:cytochrome c oxidase assembly protein subunit 11
MPRLRRNNRVVAVALFAVVGGMVGLAYASVPLYRLFCQVTGYGGTPQTGAQVKTAAARVRPTSELITVEFDANVNGDLPWTFAPEQRRIQVHLGEQTLVFFKAKNISDRPVTGMATFNVSPHKAGSYFSKIECFCFTEQTLNPGEEIEMPVSFYVDPGIHKDEGTSDVRSITLSYTFFRTLKEPPKDNKVSAARPGADSRQKPGKT